MSKTVAFYTSRDPMLSQVHKWILHGWPEKRFLDFQPYTTRKDELSEQLGCVLWGSQVVSSPSSAVTERMLRHTFATHGSPHVIISDNACSFTSKEFSRFCALNGIKHVVHHITPSLNGLAEHAVQTIKSGLKKLLEIWKRDYCMYWPDTIYSRNQQWVNHQQCN